MITSLSLICSALASFRSRSIRLKGALTALLFLLPLLCAHASAQTTAISGTVYDPRTTASRASPAQCAGLCHDRDGGAAAFRSAVPDHLDAHRRGQLHLLPPWTAPSR